MQPVVVLKRLELDPNESVLLPINMPRSPNRTRKGQEDDDPPYEDPPYVKQPRNAFMIFIEKQRTVLLAELGVNNIVVVSKEAAKRWKSLSKLEKEKYFEEARAEARLHAEKHPGWTKVENYGKRRR